MPPGEEQGGTRSPSLLTPSLPLKRAVAFRTAWTHSRWAASRHVCFYVAPCSPQSKLSAPAAEDLFL